MNSMAGIAWGWRRTTRCSEIRRPLAGVANDSADSLAGVQ